MFSPAIGLSNRLSFAAKFSLIAVAFSLPAAIMCTSIYRQNRDVVEFAARERLGATVLKAVFPIFESTENGTDATPAAVRAALDRIRRDTAELDATKELDAILSAADAKGRESACGDLISKVYNTSKIVLDPDADSYYAGALVSTLPETSTFLVSMRAALSAPADPRSLETLISLSATLRVHNLVYVQQAIDAIERERPDVGARLGALAKAANGSVSDFLAGVDKVVQSRSTPPGLATAADRAIAAQHALLDAALPALDEMLARRIAGQDTSLAETAALSLGGVLVAAYLFVGVYLGLRRALAELGRTARAISGGDLTARTAVSSDDEIGKIAASFNEATRNVGALIDRVRSAVSVANAKTRESMSLTQAIERRTNEQESSAEASAAAIDQTAASVATVADGSEEATAISARMKSAAEAGQRLVADTVDALNRVQHSVVATERHESALGDVSAQIERLAGQVSDIAVQTNLLALNAAIEAARAGEAGRGFAVVADEVRKLSATTSEATKAITALVKETRGSIAASMTSIGEARQEIDRSCGIADRLKNTFVEVVDLSAETDRSSREVLAAMREQKSATDILAVNVSRDSHSIEHTHRDALELLEHSEEICSAVESIDAASRAFRL
jgi:methyl-accepting chemotaxis protein